MRLSARNQITGTVTEITEGAVNGIVKIGFADTAISATISMSGNQGAGSCGWKSCNSSDQGYICYGWG